ncbi:MAG: alpha/beta hydrolase [Candidatus Dormiibacterota bacterium]
MFTTTHALNLDGVGPVEVRVDDHGEGQPFLLLHGGAGPNSTGAFSELLATSKPARVLHPTHPGFGGTPRPGLLHTIRGLAALYVGLVEMLGLDQVTVVGNSTGGWIAAEMALIGSARMSGAVLIDAVGIQAPGHPVADFFSLSMDQMFALSFHDPDRFRFDPSTLPPAAQAIAAGNRSALASYAGTAMSDPTLRERLSCLDMAVLVLWGDSDRIADAEYGRAYAEAIPMARFQLLRNTGHQPQMETPDQVLKAVWDYAETDRPGVTG